MERFIYTSIFIITFIITLMYISFSFADCKDEPNRPSGEEIVCPAEARPSSQDLKEKGLGIADMPIIDELECKATDDKTGKVTYGLCEHRKAADNPLIYIVIYVDETREDIKMILIFNPATNETVCFYDVEKKRDI